MFSAEVQGSRRVGSLRRSTLAGTAVAVVGVSACYLIADAIGDELTVAVADRAAMAVPFGAAVFATVAAGAGAYVLALLARRARHPRRAFLVMTLLGLLLSVVPPVQAATTSSTSAWLLVMHAVAAMALIPVVARAVPAVRPESRSVESASISEVESAADLEVGDR